MDHSSMAKTPLRRSFSENVKLSTNKAWDVFWKNARENRLWEIEAKEACDWLKAAGFPQYVQLFREGRFPIKAEWAVSDHPFLDKDAHDSLCRRLNTLNKCVEMRLEPRSKPRDADSEEDIPCSISPYWSYDRPTHRWRRLTDSAQMQEVPMPDASHRHDTCSLHSTGSSESEGQEEGLHKSHGITTTITTTSSPSIASATDDMETGRSSSRCSTFTNKTPSLDNWFGGLPSPGSLEAECCLQEKPPKKKGPSFLQTIEKLRLKGTSTLRPPSHDSRSQAQLVISGPLPLQHGPPVEDSLQVQPGSSSYPYPSSPQSPSSCSSQSESSSSASTPSPITRVRSNCKRPINLNLQRDLLDHGEAHMHQTNNANSTNRTQQSPVFQIPQGHKPGTFPTSLAHKNPALTSVIDHTSVNWRTGSFHGYRGSRRGVRTHPVANSQDPSSSSCSPDAGSPCRLALTAHRASFYDNVPDRPPAELTDQETGQVSSPLTDEDVFLALDGVMKRISHLQQLVSSWSDSLSEDDSQRGSSSSGSASSGSASPNHVHLEVTAPEELKEDSEEVSTDQVDRKMKMPQSSRRVSQKLHLHAAPPCPGLESLPVSSLHLLQKLSLLKLTSLMDKHSPSSKQGWSWTLPKPLRKTRLEMKARRVFGVPLLHVAQTGHPLPPGILQAMLYLRTECLDQVGLFRKSGVRSRIQALRGLLESDPDNVDYRDQSAFDVADLVKQYFRDLPEPVFTNQLCQCFLHIYQYFPKDQQLVAAQAAILLLPDENRETLQTLVLFLRDVVSCVQENHMTPTNIAVCLAPSLFHLNTLKRETSRARPSHRKASLGRPDQRDLSENLAATQALAHMISTGKRLFQVPDLWPGLELVCGEGRIHEEASQEDSRSRLEQNTERLLREARERRGWENLPAPENSELASKKMDDGCPLWLWRGSVEVESPQKELLYRLMREQSLWEPGVRQEEVVQTLSEHAEIYRYYLQSQGLPLTCRPPQEYLLLRTWQSDPSLGPVYLSCVSTLHPQAPAETWGARVLSCLYLLEPIGPRRSRITHLYRADTRGRSQEWDRKVSGHLLASRLLSIRDSFRPDQRDTKT